MGHHIFCNSPTEAGQFYVFMSNGEGDKQLWRSVKAWSRGLIEICMVRLVYGSLLQTIFLPSLQDMTSAAATLSHRRSALAIYYWFSFSKNHIVKNPHETTMKAAKLPSASLCRQWFTSQSFFSAQSETSHSPKYEMPKKIFSSPPHWFGFLWTQKRNTSLWQSFALINCTPLPNRVVLQVQTCSP